MNSDLRDLQDQQLLLHPDNYLLQDEHLLLHPDLQEH